MANVSRQDLYALVWSEPVKNIAPTFGILYVALSKICRKHNLGLDRVPQPQQFAGMACGYLPYVLSLRRAIETTWVFPLVAQRHGRSKT